MISARPVIPPEAVPAKRLRSNNQIGIAASLMERLLSRSAPHPHFIHTVEMQSSPTIPGD